MGCRTQRMELVLASASPRRRELLRRLRHPFRVLPPRIEEAVREPMAAEQTAMCLAEAKARDVASRLSSGLVIGADTVVEAGGRLIGKPGDRDDAKRILRRLAGTQHAVVTGVCIVDAATGRTESAADRTRIKMRPMSEHEIEDYVDSGEPLGKAGAYAIQEHGDRYVESIEGSFSNVVGLPLELLAQMLQRF